MSYVTLPPGKGQSLVRFLTALVKTKGDPVSAAAMARAHGWSREFEVLQRAAVAPVDRNDATPAINSFLDDIATVVRAQLIIGRLTEIRRVRSNTRLITPTTGNSGKFVGEGAPAPVSEMAWNGDYSLPMLKAVGITVVTQEMIMNALPGTEDRLAADLIAGVADGINRNFIDPAYSAITNVRPASITNDVAPVANIGVPTVTSVDAAIRAAVAQLTNIEMALTSSYWVMSPKFAVWLATARLNDGAPAYPTVSVRAGGTLAGIPVILSTSCNASGSPGEEFCVLVEASDVVMTDDASPEVSISKAFAIQMDDSPSAGASTLVSAFQLGLVGIRATVPMNFRKRRANSVAVISGITL